MAPATVALLRRVLRWGLALLVVTALATLWNLGRILAQESPLESADAIYVLGGNWAERGLEATDLFREGRAPHIVISNAVMDRAHRELVRRGVTVVRAGNELAAIMSNRLGVPADAIETLPDELDNTAQEADAIVPIVRARKWTRLIVITDRASTRRAGFALRRVLGPGVTVIMRAPRLDLYDPARWWRRRADVRTTMYELPKLLAYYSGLRG